MSRRRRNRKAKLKAELNVVPYIDVMLVLLVIFMVSAPLIQQSSIDIDLPDNEAQIEMPADASPEVLPLILTVNREGQYFLNRGEEEKALNEEEIIQLTASTLQSLPTLPVLVQGDATVNYEKIIAGIALLQRAGAKKVGLVTEPPKEE